MAATVLLIEDEPHITEALSFLLKRDGWDVTTHSDGADATEKIAQLTPDLVILDIMLPNRNGMQILEDIRQDQALAHTPVLMLTAKGQRKDSLAAKDAGVSLFMTKPFSNTEIIENARKLIG